MLSRAPTRVIRNWICDSGQWSGFSPRDGDVVIATAPKVGTTWTQQIVNLLIFQTAQPRPLWQLSPWLDARFQIPIEVALPMLEAQTHRRFLKTHLPMDALPIFDEVRYIHVARDGRDACMSFLNHFNGFTPEIWARLDGIGMADETIGRPYPRPPRDAREFFHFWMTDIDSKMPMMSDDFFALEQSYWRERRRPNVLLVHYNDLKADLSGEMKRIAGFLNITVPDELWPQLVEAASFEAMKRDGAKLLAGMDGVFQNGHETFLHRGANNQWRGVFTEADLDSYEKKVHSKLSAPLLRWLSEGRSRAGNPESTAD